jgi:hypothetical protein
MEEIHMTRIGIVRCEKNMDRCPLTNCLRCLDERKEGFAGYEDCQLTGLFVCRCPGENATDLARILKSKGAEPFTSAPVPSQERPKGAGPSKRAPSVITSTKT